MGGVTRKGGFIELLHHRRRLHAHYDLAEQRGKAADSVLMWDQWIGILEYLGLGKHLQRVSPAPHSDCGLESEFHNHPCLVERLFSSE